MIKEDIPLYKLDLTATDKFNKVDLQAMTRRPVKNNNIFIPPGAPFYQKSFKMYGMDGSPLVEGEDWEFYGMMGKLTQFTAKPVGLFVRLLKDEITEWKVDYQVVGNFNKITNEILNMLHGIYEDDRFVWWDNIENKPLWFIPEVHQHDLAYQIYGFTDLVKELGRVAELQVTLKQADEVIITQMQTNLDYYIDGFKKILKNIVDSHNANKKDAHGVNKNQIGLDLVDNYATATLEETIDGLRDDLHITPYNAALAAEGSAGLNQRLFPSGSLPLLRYGNDTFIPPTISGSFEGLGGVTRRAGGIVETDGTLLILENRNNGKIRGLYFVRCANPMSQDAQYEFTSYRYTHPTATSEGATLDMIVSGSNEFIMVVGDTKKNMWYWCETHGTFNPDRHVLHRITGPWVAQDTIINKGFEYIQNPFNKCMLMADANYKEKWAIFQPYSIDDFWNRAKRGIPDYLYFSRKGINIGNMGYSINVFSNLSNNAVRALVNFTHPKFGNWNDQYFTPWWPEIRAISDTQADILSYHAEYDPPTKDLYNQRTVHAFWKKNTAKTDTWSFRMQTTAIESNESGGQYQFGVIWRGNFEIKPHGTYGWVVNITPAIGNEKLWKIDPFRRQAGIKEYADFSKYMISEYHYDTSDCIGSFILNGEYVHMDGGVGNSSFPPSYSIAKAPYLKSAEALLLPTPSGAGGPYYEDTGGYKVFPEENPLGLGTLFSEQRMIAMNTSDYTSGGLLCRQGGPEGAHWKVRPVNFIQSDWTHRAPPSVGNFNGTNVKYYPLVSMVRNTNLGQQLLMNQWVPRDGIGLSNKPYRYLFGAAADTVLLGIMDRDKVVKSGEVFGDNLFIEQCNTSIVSDEVIFQPTVVFNLKNLVSGKWLTALQPLGYTADDVRQTWTLTRITSASGELLDLLYVNRLIGDNSIGAAVMVGKVTGTGTPRVVDGYQLYDTSDWVTYSGPTEAISFNTSVNRSGFAHRNYGGIAAQSQGIGIGLTIPWKSRAADDTITDGSTSTTYIRPVHGYLTVNGPSRSAIAVEVRASDRSIVRIAAAIDGMWPAQISIQPQPYTGFIKTDPGITIFEGAAIAGSGPSSAANVFDGLTTPLVTGMFMGISNIIAPLYTIYFQAIKDVLLSGKTYDIPSTYIDLLVQDANPANKIYYVYLIYSGTTATYKAVTTVLPESSTQSLIAKVICGPTQIDSIIPYNRFSMDGASISALRQGSSILASSGSVYEIGNTTGILLDADYVPE